MNSTATHSTLSPSNAPAPATVAEDEVELGHYFEALVAQKWLIAAIALVVLAIGVVYAALQRPVYESNLLIQVEDTEGASKTFLAEATSAFDVKTPSSAEMEIIRSRTVLGQAIDATKLDIVATPRYVPYVGGWLARRATGLSDPGFLGMPGYVSGTEQIVVANFNVPARLEANTFTVVAKGGGQYALQHPTLAQPLTGTVGTPLKADTRDGPIELTVAELAGKPGAEYSLTKLSRLSTIGSLQARLGLTEKGKQSGIINVSMEDNNPVQLARVLNAVGAQYVRQNVERKAAEAQKTLSFLDVQLPMFKRQLEQSEEVYNRYRNQKGTVAFTEEASLVLGTAVDRQTRLLDLQQRRRDLESRFTSAHPSVQTLDAQIAALQRDIGDVQTRIKSLPALQQEAVRMERDVKVNTELYQSLLNNAMQLRLVKEGKVGNVRVLDEAVVPEGPIKPNRRTIVAVAFALGLFLGIVVAFIRNALIEQRIKDPHEVESQTALPVFSTIPVSVAQTEIAQRRLTGATGVRLLAIERPDDLAVESLRSLRTAMQFAMLEAPNNRVMITGATPGVGKSFVTSNFAALMAAAGKRTLLIDADLRRGHLHQYLGLQRHGGLSELIAGSLTIQQTVHRQVVPNLDFLATGQLPPNPAELLTSDSFTSTLGRLSEQYDMVVIDTPPVLVASDTAAIATHAGTVLLVARANLSSMGELKESTRRLALGGKAATGVLLNAMDAKRRAYGGYKYGRYRYTNYNYESILPEEQ
ncbi:polysaccharide biosynthesis tyrosine autokinase [Variovorax sp. J22G21]|uniref:polysaccharide biosynthesis tyrosine autokinase n=1 Tax=Variovorax fucosicus TaxID=3053517 RepID=UPI0025774017|nr:MULTISPECIES: polysaccharide biosynthesis tyrosine autokinase [unclassified Variovorax]MDM0040186.1 polysaccharide biosynthesis tyrosine autokinase [Variovorax sp. J22R193]MDM0058305.1 polysaccharide biosynthesis tyrosine autokinase [Variovorax sp. J22G47]MDM0061559.1 polysaccharide biosynthesis tyrosine autokinase [Variovorax sp. J22G21]